jgi:glucose/arabinose dehydrogenase
LDSFTPSDIEFAPLGSQDPPIPLALGKRYQVKVTNYGQHPFEILAKGSTPSQDLVILSMSVNPSLESDPEIDWQDDGRGTVQFTMTMKLYEAMTRPGHTPGYRCRPHLFQMRGDFIISGLPIAERIQPSSVAVDLEVVAGGLAAPVALVQDPIDSQRLHIVDQAGQVLVLDHDQLLEAPFLDVTGLIVSPLGFLGSFDEDDFDERGLLGLAFHPDFDNADRPGHRTFFTYTSEPVDGPGDFTVDLPLEQMNHQSVIRAWQAEADGTAAIADSSRVILRIDQPQFNHDGGHIEFGPDRYLYIALGDGGGANDTDDGHGLEGNGQNLQTVHGSILRIDPLAPEQTPDSTDPASPNGAYRIPADNPFVGTDGIDEIYAYGLRNPYRFSFDRTGRLILPDVGQDFVEEINIGEKGGNYGWNIKEGSFKFDPEGEEVGVMLDAPTLIDPVAEYDHDDGLSIIGGYISYGNSIPELWGQYVFADFSRGFFSPDGRILVADLNTGVIEELLLGASGESLGLFIKGMGQDADGEVYVLASTALGPYGTTGQVLKLVPAAIQFEASLSGANAGTDSTATGRAVFTVNESGDALTYRLEVSDIVDVTMAHIHIASEPGENGPPAVWLYPSTPPASQIPGPFSGLLGEGEVTAANFIGPLAGAQFADLLKAFGEGRAYVNVHTLAHAGGEIRDAIQPRAPFRAASASLQGSSTSAQGLAVLQQENMEDPVTYRLRIQGLHNTTMAHIHVAAEPGGNGPPAVWLYPAAPPAVLLPGEFNGLLAEGEISDADFIGPLAGKSIEDLWLAVSEGRAYVNLHTEQVPGGEINGYLE